MVGGRPKDSGSGKNTRTQPTFVQSELLKPPVCSRADALVRGGPPGPTAQSSNEDRPLQKLHGMPRKQHPVPAHLAMHFPAPRRRLIPQ